MAKTIKHFLNFLFPITCAGCGVALGSDDYFRLCSACQDKINLIDGFYCKKCCVPLPDGGAHCYSCRKNPGYHFEYIRSYGQYCGLLKELIHKFKYYGKDYLERIFGKMLIQVIEKNQVFKEVDFVIPVPMHWLKKIKRGYNQTELLAGAVSEYINKPILDKVLIRRKLTRSQVSLKLSERIQNVHGSFIVKNSEKIKKKKVLLIDDVCTTCSTIEACSKALRKAGANKIYVMTLARD